MKAGQLGAMALVLALPAGASAQTATSGTATSSGSVMIVRPLTITRGGHLVFGRVIKPRTGTGTVRISPTSNAVTATGGAVRLPGITTRRAAFTVRGEGGQVVSLSIPATMTMQLGTSASQITVTLLPNITTGTTTLTNTPGTRGTRTVNIGGQFSLPATQASGAYTGTFTVTAAYQ